MENNTLVFSVIYPSALKYLEDFVQSLSRQRDKQYDLLWVLDGIQKNDIEKNLMGLNRGDVYFIESDKSIPSYNRELAIRYAIDKKYKNLIPLDCDDTYYEEKIGFLKEKLERHEVVVHDMDICDEGLNRVQQGFIRKRYQEVGMDLETFLEKNICGFGNSGFRVEGLKACLPIPAEIKVVDWWAITNYLLNNNKVGVYSERLMGYRQQEVSYAETIKITRESVINQINIKLLHYHSLLQKEMSGYQRNLIQEKYNKYRAIQSQIEEKPEELDEKLRMIDQTQIYLWWEISAVIWEEEGKRWQKKDWKIKKS